MSLVGNVQLRVAILQYRRHDSQTRALTRNLVSLQLILLPLVLQMGYRYLLQYCLVVVSSFERGQSEEYWVATWHVGAMAWGRRWITALIASNCSEGRLVSCLTVGQYLHLRLSGELLHRCTGTYETACTGKACTLEAFVCWHTAKKRQLCSAFIRRQSNIILT
jgi:hypothetical protein